jgi:hypothetical protein
MDRRCARGSAARVDRERCACAGMRRSPARLQPPPRNPPAAPRPTSDAQIVALRLALDREVEAREQLALEVAALRDQMTPAAAPRVRRRRMVRAARAAHASRCSTGIHWSPRAFRPPMRRSCAPLGEHGDGQDPSSSIAPRARGGSARPSTRRS